MSWRRFLCFTIGGALTLLLLLASGSPLIALLALPIGAGAAGAGDAWERLYQDAVWRRGWYRK